MLPLRIISLFVSLFIHGFCSLIEKFMTVILFVENIMLFMETRFRMYARVQPRKFLQTLPSAMSLED